MFPTVPVNSLLFCFKEHSNVSLVPIVWAKVTPVAVTSTIIPLDFNYYYPFFSRRGNSSHSVFHDGYKTGSNCKQEISTKSARMWKELLNPLAGDFFCEPLGNVLMLKNGTGTEKCWSLLRGFMDSLLTNSRLFWTPVYLKSCLFSLSYLRLIFLRVCMFVIQAWIICT